MGRVGDRRPGPIDLGIEQNRQGSEISGAGGGCGDEPLGAETHAKGVEVRVLDVPIVGDLREMVSERVQFLRQPTLSLNEVGEPIF